MQSCGTAEECTAASTGILTMDIGIKACVTVVDLQYLPEVLSMKATFSTTVRTGAAFEDSVASEAVTCASHELCCWQGWKSQV